MSGGKKTTTSNSTTNQQTSGSSSLLTSPNVPSYIQAPAMNYFSQVYDLAGDLTNNPDMFMTPANALQRDAYSDAFQNLGAANKGLSQSNNLALSAANAAAPSYQAPTIGDISKVADVTVNGASLGPAQLAQLIEAQAAQAGPAASLLDNGLDRYFNPYLQNVIDTTLSDYDQNAAAQRVAQQAAAAKAGAFGSSRLGLREAELEGQLARGRAAADANLRAAGFDTAANLANLDAGRRQETELFNTGNQQQTNLANAQFGNQTNQFNAGQQNQQAQAQAQLAQQAELARAQIAAQAAQANAEAENQRSLQQALLEAQGGMFNAGQQSDALARQLQAAGLLSNNANSAADNARQDLGTMFNIGEGMRQIDQENALSRATGLGILQGALDPALVNQLSGQSVIGNTSGSLFGTENGKEVQTSSGGLLGSLGGLLSLGSMLIPGVGPAIGLGSALGGAASTGASVLGGVNAARNMIK